MNDRNEYKEKIIEMVNRIDNVDCLFKIYHYIIPKYKKGENYDRGNEKS